MPRTAKEAKAQGVRALIEIHRALLRTSGPETDLGQLEHIRHILDREAAAGVEVPLRKKISDSETAGNLGVHEVLHLACQRGQLEIVKCLVSYIEHSTVIPIERVVGAMTSTGNTPLGYAIKGDHLELYRYLVDVGGTDKLPSDVTPVELAITTGAIKILRYLTSGARESHGDEELDLLDLACNHGTPEVVQYLVEARDGQRHYKFPLVQTGYAGGLRIWGLAHRERFDIILELMSSSRGEELVGFETLYHSFQPDGNGFIRAVTSNVINMTRQKQPDLARIMELQLEDPKTAVKYARVLSGKSTAEAAGLFGLIIFLCEGLLELKRQEPSA